MLLLEVEMLNSLYICNILHAKMIISRYPNCENFKNYKIEKDWTGSPHALILYLI